MALPAAAAAHDAVHAAAAAGCAGWDDVGGSPPEDMSMQPWLKGGDEIQRRTEGWVLSTPFVGLLSAFFGSRKDLGHGEAVKAHRTCLEVELIEAESAWCYMHRR